MPTSSPELSTLITSAFSGGVETSIEELARVLGHADETVLTAAGLTLQFVEKVGLELLPSADTGEFATARVLRARARSVDPTGQVRAMMHEGEGQNIEFKSSLLCSIHHWENEGELVELGKLTGEVLKTICAFLNSSGGDLLIGVDDDGASCGGVQRDLELKAWNIDKWQLNLLSLVNARFHEGRRVLPYLQMSVAEVESFPVVRLQVTSRSTASFVKRDTGGPYEFFVRVGPRTDSLDMPALHDHLMSRLGA